MDPNRKPEITTEALLAIVAACGFALALLNSPFTAERGRSVGPTASSTGAKPAGNVTQPAVREPALRSLQGVVEHR